MQSAAVPSLQFSGRYLVKLNTSLPPERVIKAIVAFNTAMRTQGAPAVLESSNLGWHTLLLTTYDDYFDRKRKFTANSNANGGWNDFTRHMVQACNLKDEFSKGAKRIRMTLSPFNLPGTVNERDVPFKVGKDKSHKITLEDIDRLAGLP